CPRGPRDGARRPHAPRHVPGNRPPDREALRLEDGRQLRLARAGAGACPPRLVLHTSSSGRVEPWRMRESPPGLATRQEAPAPGHWFESDPLWFKRAVFYEIHIRGFFDANDDGSGDFRGLTEKLDYLQWLGVDCIWLLPMYASPLRDGGYDIADFYSVHP